MVLYGAKTWTLRIVAHKHMGSFEMRCWRRAEIIWADRVKNRSIM